MCSPMSTRDWVARLNASLLIEFVTKDDPMVQGLLRNKEDSYRDYDQSLFEQLLAANYRNVRKVALTSGTRYLYFAS